MSLAVIWGYPYSIINIRMPIRWTSLPANGIRRPSGRERSCLPLREPLCAIFFFVAKLWYVMHVLHCSRANILRLHRVFDLFIWMAKRQPMRRDNNFRSVKSKEKVRRVFRQTHFLFLSEVVSRFKFLRDQEHLFLAYCNPK